MTRGGSGDAWHAAAVGDALPVLTVHPTLTQVVMYAAAMWEYQRIHFDPEWAAMEGLPGPIVHGPLLGNYLVQTLTRWTSLDATIRHLDWRNRGIAPIGEPLTCGGQVTSTERTGSVVTIACDLWIDNQRGKRIVTGSAVMSRGEGHSSA